VPHGYNRDTGQKVDVATFLRVIEILPMAEHEIYRRALIGVHECG
jgi:hypothetical protein